MIAAVAWRQQASILAFDVNRRLFRDSPGLCSAGPARGS